MQQSQSFADNEKQRSRINHPLLGNIRLRRNQSSQKILNFERVRFQAVSAQMEPQLLQKYQDKSIQIKLNFIGVTGAIDRNP